MLFADTCPLSADDALKEILEGASDCNGNKIPDRCDLETGGFGFTDIRETDISLLARPISQTVYADFNGDNLTDFAFTNPSTLDLRIRFLNENQESVSDTDIPLNNNTHFN